MSPVDGDASFEGSIEVAHLGLGTERRLDRAKAVEGLALERAVVGVEEGHFGRTLGMDSEVVHLPVGAADMA